jgi:hypothetical protein
MAITLRCIAQSSRYLIAAAPPAAGLSLSEARAARERLLPLKHSALARFTTS